jgi:adenosine 3'-phospho 5'-phosphosulfate transporter B2
MLAGAMSAGVALFMFSREGGEAAEGDGTGFAQYFAGLLSPASFGGGALLVGYMVFDSFTSNYQSLLFKEHGMSSYQMMFGINLFSCVFTLWALLQQGTLSDCIAFAAAHPDFLWHNIVLALTSATGQIFIFRTLALYGTLVFTIIMTTLVAYA